MSDRTVSHLTPDDVIAAGQGKPPLDVANALQRWNTMLAEEQRADPAMTADRWYRGSSKAQAQLQPRLEELRVQHAAGWLNDQLQAEREAVTEGAPPHEAAHATGGLEPLSVIAERWKGAGYNPEKLPDADRKLVEGYLAELYRPEFEIEAARVPLVYSAGESPIALAQLRVPRAPGATPDALVYYQGDNEGEQQLFSLKPISDEEAAQRVADRKAKAEEAARALAEARDVEAREDRRMDALTKLGFPPGLDDNAAYAAAAYAREQAKAAFQEADAAFHLYDQGGKLAMYYDDLARQIKDAGKAGEFSLLGDVARGLVRVTVNTGQAAQRAVIKAGLAETDFAPDLAEALDAGLPGSSGRRFRAGKWDQIVTGAAESLGYMAPVLASGGASALVQGTARTGATASVLALSPASYGRGYSDAMALAKQLEAAGDIDRAQSVRRNADAAGIMQSIIDTGTEMLLPGHAPFSRAGKSVARSAGRFALGAAGEGVEEIAAGALERGVKDPLADPLGPRRAITEGMDVEFLTGALAAGPMQAMGILPSLPQRFGQRGARPAAPAEPVSVGFQEPPPRGGGATPQPAPPPAAAEPAPAPPQPQPMRPVDAAALDQTGEAVLPDPSADLVRDFDLRRRTQERETRKALAPKGTESGLAEPGAAEGDIFEDYAFLAPVRAQGGAPFLDRNSAQRVVTLNGGRGRVEELPDGGGFVAYVPLKRGDQPVRQAERTAPRGRIEEHPAGDQDFLYWLGSHPVRSKGSIKGQLPPEYDDLIIPSAPGLRGIYSPDGRMPDQVIEEAYREGWIEESTPAAFNAAIEESVRTRQAIREAMRMEEEGAKQATAFGKAQAQLAKSGEGAIEIDPLELQPGESIQIKGERATVREVGDDYVILEDGSRFGRQLISGREYLFIDAPEQGEGAAGFLPPDEVLRRDLSKPEQMTPEELGSRELTTAEIAEAVQDGTNSGIRFLSGLDAMRGKGFNINQREHGALVHAAASLHKPVSSKAVDLYKIKLPDGYVKKGDLYVFNEPEPFDLGGVQDDAQMRAEQAEAQARQAASARRDQLAEGQAKPLRGDSSDVGQSQLFEDPEGGDLFAGPSAEAAASTNPPAGRGDQPTTRAMGGERAAPAGTKFASQEKADAAARAAGYEVVGVWHYSTRDTPFDVWDFERSGGLAYFAEEQAYAKDFGIAPIRAALRVENPLDVRDLGIRRLRPAEFARELQRRGVTELNENTREALFALGDTPEPFWGFLRRLSESGLIADLKRAGFDGVRQVEDTKTLKGKRIQSEVYAVFAPEQIKRTDVETRDLETGEPIQVSQRFDRRSPSMLRDSLRPGQDTTRISRASRFYDVFAEAGLDPDAATLKPADEQFDIAAGAVRERFGFREVSRQTNARDAADGLMDARAGLQDMAAALGLPAPSMGLFKRLALQIGGASGKHLAYYRPGTKLIAMAGRVRSFAHEWGHAWSNWLVDTADYIPDKVLSSTQAAPARRRNQETTFKGKLDDAFSELLRALYYDGAAYAARLMELKGKLAAAKTDAQRDRAAKAIDTLVRGAARKDSLAGEYLRNAKASADPGYLANPDELLARAFEAYTSYKIGQIGGVREFVTKPDAEYVQNFAQLYPPGPQRQAIFEGFDRIFAAMREESLIQGEGAEQFSPTALLEPRYWPSAPPQAAGIAARVKELIEEEREQFRADLRAREKAKAQPGTGKKLGTKLNDLRFAAVSSMRTAIRGIARRYEGAARAAAEALADKLATEPGSGRYIRETIHEESEREEKRHTSRHIRLYQKYGLNPENLSEKQEAEIRAILLEGEGAATSRKMRGLGADLRRMMDDLFRLARNSGIDLGYVEGTGYLPRLYDRNAAWLDQAGFADRAAQVYAVMDAQQEAKLMAAIDAAELTGDPAAIDAAVAALEAHEKGVADHPPEARAEEWLGRLLYGGDFQVERAGPTENFAKGRELPPEADQLMEPFLIRDPVELINTYIGSVTRRIAYVRRFGQDGKAEKGYYQKMREGRMHPDDLQEIQNLVDIGLGRQRFRTSASLSGWLSALHFYGTVTMLPRATWSSLTETLVAGIRTGSALDSLRATAHTVASMARTGKARDFKELAEYLGVVSDVAHDTLLANRFGGVFGDTPGRQRALAKFFRRTGLTALTRHQQYAAFRLAVSYLKNQSGRAAQGDANAQAELAEVGVTPKMAAWLATDPDLSPDALKDSRYESKLAGAALRIVNQTIQSPNAWDRPRLANNPAGRVFYSILSFSMAFVENILKGSARRIRRNPRAAMGILPAAAALWAAQTLVSAARFALTARDKWEEEEGDTFLQKAFNSRGIATGFTRAFPLGIADTAIQGVFGLKYERDLATSMSGAHLSYFLTALQRIAGVASDRNSPNTSTAERRALQGVFDGLLVPALNATLARLPGGPALGAVYGAAMQTLGTRTVKDIAINALIPADEESPKSEANPVETRPNSAQFVGFE